MYHLRRTLDTEALARCQDLLAAAEWGDGRVTAGTQAVQQKNNRQLPETSAASHTLRSIVLEALSKQAEFFTAALPRRIYPPLFNRYDGAQNSFGNHVDNAVRTDPQTATHVRTDMAFTLFLSDPNSYDGGELILEDGLGGRAVKLPAGDLILYPAYAVHRVEPVTRGTRLACFSWLESMVRDPQQRRLLHDMDLAILSLRQQHGDGPETVQLTSCYHNLLRQWATV